MEFEIRGSHLPVILSILAIIISCIAIYSSYSTNEDTSNTQWACASQECARYISGQEWVNTFCYTNQTSGEALCNVIIDEQPYVVPLDMVDVSTVSSCVEYKCAQEILIRNN